MIENLHKETCVELLNTKFRLLEAAPGLELELVAVEGPGIEKGEERFSLIFRGPLEQPFAQGLWTLEHDKLGALGLFLVPIAREPDGMRYEAAFSRFAE